MRTRKEIEARLKDSDAQWTGENDRARVGKCNTADFHAGFSQALRWVLTSHKREGS